MPQRTVPATTALPDAAATVERSMRRPRWRDRSSTSLRVSRADAAGDDDCATPRRKLVSESTRMPDTKLLATDRPALGGIGTAAEQPGTRHPHDVATPTPLVERAFAFVDLCGFTTFLTSEGEHAAIESLRRFRVAARDIATRRGVQVTKWLGDGAMLTAHEVGPAIATAAELVARGRDDVLPLRGGVAHGAVLLFDGDDYIGRPTNLASRLCDAARPGELLAVGYPADALPRWIEVTQTRDLTLRSIGVIRDVQHLAVATDVPRT